MATASETNECGCALCKGLIVGFGVTKLVPPQVHDTVATSKMVLNSLVDLSQAVSELAGKLNREWMQGAEVGSVLKITREVRVLESEVARLKVRVGL